MFTVRKMIQDIRYTVHDTLKVKYTDDYIVDMINFGIRFIRRQIKNIRPQMLIEEITGNIAAGKISIDLPIIPKKIIDVYVGGQQITSINFRTIEKPQNQGKTSHYYIIGIKTLCLYPVPASNTDYIIRVIGNVSLNIEEKTSWSDDLDDFLIEYVCIRLLFADNFKSPQEMQLLLALADKIHDNIHNIEETQMVIDGYL